MKIEALRNSETSLSIYQPTQRNIPGDFNRHQHRCDNFKHRAIKLLKTTV
jgi:hypothetical protein